MAKDKLTNEELRVIFNDNFKLANFIIKKVQTRIHGGDDEVNVTHVLDDVKKHPPEITDIENV